jgi:hypothetical protein
VRRFVKPRPGPSLTSVFEKRPYMQDDASLWSRVNCSNGFGSGYFAWSLRSIRRESTCHRTPARARALRHHRALSIGSQPQMIAPAFPLTIRLFCLVTESRSIVRHACAFCTVSPKGRLRSAIGFARGMTTRATRRSYHRSFRPDGADRSQCGSWRTRPRDGPLGMPGWRHNYEVAPEMPGRWSASPGIFANVLVLAKSQ